MNNSDLDNKIATAATKAELKEEQDKMLKLQVISVVKAILKMMACKIIYYFSQALDISKENANSYISAWKSNELSDEKFLPHLIIVLLHC